MAERWEAFLQWAKETLWFLRVLLGLPLSNCSPEDAAAIERLLDIRHLFYLLDADAQEHVLRTTLRLYDRQGMGQHLPSVRFASAESSLEHFEQLIGTAYHEAGHAVAASAYGVNFGLCSIIKSDVAGSYGRVHAVAEKVPEDVNMVIHLAGPAAAWRLKTQYGRELAPEDARLDLALELIQLPEAERNASDLPKRIEAGAQLVREILMDPEYWAAVESLAVQLVEERRIGGGRAKRIIADAMQAVRDK